ncbi:MAG: fatty acyl-AMP ligase [Cylindrospermopsis raciborskii KL1]|jgi:acyl-CoA synthetase (AMP-forming)/AMP-acid ligase II|uniref:fatty acyl-AMP ligase n=1 Tax=Cylindrospermopsis raciborskii TaxID=77022 RepID=UPI001A322D0C|nr:fatty acyl-AMP ligase [Cylindrospermopsis raciborskii]MBG0744341.1 fatty acyl-AMP ligase [Cylindrospermopsis raciborskii KL1]
MLSLLSILDQRASQNPEKLAYIFLKDGENQEQTITYQQLSQISKRIAARLQSVIPPGARALLLYPQGLEFITAFLGCLSAGIIAVPAYPPKRNQKISRLMAIIENSQPQIILTTSFILENFQLKLENSLDLSVTQFLATDNLNDDQDFEFHLPDISGNTLAFLQYTSGSTGSPKGVMISHDNIANNSVYIQKAFQLTEKSVSVTWLPSFHDMGLIDGIIQPLYTGFLGVVMSPESFLKNPIVWLQAITKYRATHSGSPNLGYELCLRRITPEQQKTLDLSSWVSAYNGAEPIRRKTLDSFIDKFQCSGFKSQFFYPCYGMAEGTLMISGGNIEDEPVYLNVQSELLENNQVLEAEKDGENYQELVGCGHAWQDTEVKIVDPESCLECGDNRVGEIWVSGSSIAQGYWQQEEKTIATFQAKLANTMDERNFLRTGDLGFLRAGELFITGRIKDVIIVWGRNHYPQDIEYSVQQSDQALRLDCGAAFTIEIDNQEKLVIVQEIERTYLSRLNVNEVFSAIRGAVALHHALQVYAIALIKPGSIPKTSSGKIQRHACRHAFLTENLVIVGKWQQNQL